MFGLLQQLIQVALHFDTYLPSIIDQYGVLTYLFICIIFFAETGFVVTPYLPGDSLLFIIGAFSARGIFPIPILIGILCIAVILGDAVNYWIGKTVGLKLFDMKIPFLKREHLEKTRAFYEHHGSKTIVIARFVPIIRTFAPFLAGVGTMPYRTFAVYNILGGILWVLAFFSAGYLFGNIPLVANNFEYVILAIILLSLLAVVLMIAGAIGFFERIAAIRMKKE